LLTETRFTWKSEEKKNILDLLLKVNLLKLPSTTNIEIFSNINEKYKIYKAEIDQHHICGANLWRQQTVIRRSFPTLYKGCQWTVRTSVLLSAAFCTPLVRFAVRKQFQLDSSFDCERHVSDTAKCNSESFFMSLADCQS